MNTNFANSLTRNQKNHWKEIIDYMKMPVRRNNTYNHLSFTLERKYYCCICSLIVMMKFPDYVNRNRYNYDCDYNVVTHDLTISFNLKSWYGEECFNAVFDAHSKFQAYLIDFLDLDFDLNDFGYSYVTFEDVANALEQFLGFNEENNAEPETPVNVKYIRIEFNNCTSMKFPSKEIALEILSMNPCWKTMVKDVYESSTKLVEQVTENPINLC